MAVAYRLGLAIPASGITNAFSLTYTASDFVCQQIDIEIKKDKRAITTMTARLADPALKIFSKLPDIAFADVPITLYTGTAADPNWAKVLVFDGLATSYQVGFPGLEHLTVVAHDKSISMRKTAKARTFANKKPIDVVKTIAAEYGLDVDDSAMGDVQQIARAIDIGIAATGQRFMSDWEHCWRVLDSVGLSMHVYKNKIVVQQTAQSVYPTTFSRGDGKVIGLECSINHVRGPGGLGNVKTNVVLDNSGTERAVSGTAATEASKSKGGEGKTHRHPIGGRASNSGSKAHSEDTGSSWSNQVTSFRGRKDEATLTMNLEPALRPIHVVNLDGWGAKIDGKWEVETVRHSLIPGAAGSQTVASLRRGTSKSGDKQTSSTVAFEYKGIK